MRVSELLSAYESFKILGEKELPFDAALDVAENIETLRVPAEVALKKRSEITEKHLDRDDKGNPIKIDENAYKLKDGNTYAKEMLALEKNEVEVGEIKKITKSILSGVNIAPIKLAPILKYIE